jgi:hypothetical protein
MTASGLLLDPTTAPTARELAASLGSTRPLWDRLVSWMLETYGLTGEPLFTTREDGWALRFRRSGRALLTLQPLADGRFKALVVLGPSVWDQVAGVGLGSVVKAAWDGAHPYPDGRWLFLAVDDDETVDDIERLIALKSPPPRRVRQRMPVS